MTVIQNTHPIAAYTTQPADTGKRLDLCAAQHIPALASRKAAYKCAKRGELLLNGEPASPHARIPQNATIHLLQPTRQPPRPYHLPVEVVWEDCHLAVVIKPPGIPVSGNYARTLERALPATLTPSPAPDAMPWPRPVHRLDAPTGGLLIVAKTASAMVALGHQFEERTVSKCYRAIATGRIETAMVIDTPLDGRAARTRLVPITCSPSPKTEWLTTLDIWPETGRTHQIRRHLALAGHPVLGDTEYGVEPILRGKGLFLWAVALRFTHPALNATLALTIEPPAKFTTQCEREARRWQTRPAFIP